MLACISPYKIEKMCAIAIKIPIDRLNKIAYDNKIETPLTNTTSKVIVKYPYDGNERLYCSFSATEKQTCIMNLLRKEIFFVK